MDIDFLSGPERTGTFNAPSAALVAEKEHFGSSRRERWFALDGGRLGDRHVRLQEGDLVGHRLLEPALP